MTRARNSPALSGPVPSATSVWVRLGQPSTSAPLNPRSTQSPPSSPKSTNPSWLTSLGSAPNSSNVTDIGESNVSLHASSGEAWFPTRHEYPSQRQSPSAVLPLATSRHSAAGLHLIDRYRRDDTVRAKADHFPVAAAKHMRTADARAAVQSL